MKDIKLIPIIPVISGPTASGKSLLALQIAEELNIEVISADAYQVYKYMDIGTSKPTPGSRAFLKHHLIDVVCPDATYSAGLFFNDAEHCVADILGNNKLPVVVGGTGLYIETLFKGIFNGPHRDNDIRKELNSIADKHGWGYLYDQLQEIDPSYAAIVSKNDKTRITRALEVYKKTGIPLTKAYKILHRKPKFKYKLFINDLDRKLIYKKINDRVEEMFYSGWIQEVDDLIRKGYPEDTQAFKAIGYREIALYLKNKSSLDDLKSDIKRKTRSYAKRQLTWFKHMDGIVYIPEDEVQTFTASFVEQYSFYLKTK